MYSQQQLFKVAELAFSHLADILSFIPHKLFLIILVLQCLIVISPSKLIGFKKIIEAKII